MDDSKIEELRNIHRDIARFLGEQHEIILSHALVISAIRETLQGDPALSGKYEANLQSLKDAEHARPNPTQAGMVRGILRRLSEW
jgi:hypothetical protein